MFNIYHIIRLFLGIICFTLMSSTSFSQFVSNEVVGDWEDGSSWEEGSAPDYPREWNQLIDVYGKITRNGNLQISETILPDSRLTVHDTLIIDGNLTIDAGVDLEIMDQGVLIINGDLDMDGLLIWGGSGTNNGDVVVKGNLNVDEEATFDTQDGNTYVEETIDDPENNIEGPVKDEEDLVDENPDLYDEAYDDCDPPPAINLLENNISGCPGSMVTFSYSGTTGNPDQYRIDFSSTAEGQGFSDISYTTLGGNDISFSVPSGVSSGTYHAVLTVRNSEEECVSDPYDLTISVSVPSITLINSNSNVCSGVTNASFSYSGTTNNPNQYSINFNEAANDEGFTDISNAPLSTSPIEIGVPESPAIGTYNAELTVENSLGCVSSALNITITILESPDPNITIDGSSDYSANDCFTEGHSLVLSLEETYNSYSWSIDPSNNDMGNLLSSSGEDAQTVTYSNFTNPDDPVRTYTISVNVNNNQCNGQTSKDFILNHRPETGNTYYVPNEFDQ